MSTSAQPESSQPVPGDIDQISINTIRTLAMDAVQQADRILVSRQNMLPNEANQYDGKPEIVWHAKV